MARVRLASGRRRLYLPHALRQMARPDRMITPAEVRMAIDCGSVIEDYPADPRGHSCLILGFGESSRPIHCLCSKRGLSCHHYRVYPRRARVDGRFPQEEREMKCVHCRGEMRRGAAPFHIDRKNCHVLLDSIPAWVCEQCGEPYFEEREVESIQDLIRSVEQKAIALAPTA